MANVVPLVVSGEIMMGQACILMSIIGNVPCYLVSDVNSFPYFQPLFQDPSTGLPAFKQYATQVTVALNSTAGITTQTQAIITPTGGTAFNSYCVDPSLLIVGPNAASGSPNIPINNLNYFNHTLVACGFRYNIGNSVAFYYTSTWYANPSAQAITGITTAKTTSFFVFPVTGLYDTSGNPAVVTVFDAVYNDILGITPTTLLFSNLDAYQAGAGQPFQYCENGSCQSFCFGQCSGKYTECHRLTNGNFACPINVSSGCKLVAMLPFLAGLFVFGGAAVWIIERQHYHNRKALKEDLAEGKALKPVYKMSTTKMVIVALLFILTCLDVATALVLVGANASWANSYVRGVCSPVGLA